MGQALSCPEWSSVIAYVGQYIYMLSGICVLIWSDHSVVPWLLQMEKHIAIAMIQISNDTSMQRTWPIDLPVILSHVLNGPKMQHDKISSNTSCIMSLCTVNPTTTTRLKLMMELDQWMRKILLTFFSAIRYLQVTSYALALLNCLRRFLFFIFNQGKLQFKCLIWRSLSLGSRCVLCLEIHEQCSYYKAH